MVSIDKPLKKPLKILLGNLAKEHPLFRLKYLGYEGYIHQAELFYKLTTRYPIRALIADEVGLGKTIEALLLIEWGLREKIFSDGRVLILVPRSIIGQWEEEAKRFKLHPSIDIETFEEKYHNPTHSMVFIFKIDTAKKDKYKSRILKYTWDLIVIDEVHKLGLDSQRMELVKELIKRNPDASILFLSATPHRGYDKPYLEILSMLEPQLKKILPSKNLHDLYTKLLNTLVFRRSKIHVNRIYEGVVREERIKEEKIFVDAKVATQKVEIDEIEKKYIEKLDQLTREILRRCPNKELKQSIGLLAMLIDKRGLSSPHAGLMTFHNILSSLSESQLRSEYSKKYFEELEDYGVEEHISKKEADTVLSEAIRYSDLKVKDLFRDFSNELEELCDLAKKVLSKDSKLSTLQKLLQEHLEKGEKVIVFTEFADTADYIYKALRESFSYEVEKISGRDLASIGEHKIEKIQKWLSEPKPRILISTDVASEGLNLQYANVVINYELPWSLTKLEQRTGRIWRLGQNRDVKIYLMILEHSFEEKIFNALYWKLANSVRAGIIPSTLIALETRDGLALPYSGIVESNSLTPFKIWEVFKRKGEKGIATLVENQLEKLKKYLEKIENTGLYIKESIPPTVARVIKRGLEKISGFETRKDFETFLCRIVNELGYNCDEYRIRIVFHDSINETSKYSIPVYFTCEDFIGSEPLVGIKICVKRSNKSGPCWFYTYYMGKFNSIKDLVSKIKDFKNCVELGRQLRKDISRYIDIETIKIKAKNYVEKEVLNVIQEPTKKYLEYIASIKLSEQSDVYIDAEPLVVIVPADVRKVIEKEIEQRVDDIIEPSDITEEKLEIEAKGRIILEKVLGDKYKLIYVGDTKAPFDYIAKDEVHGNTIFIELKTLEKLKYIVLTESEKEFAERVSSTYEYWLYIVDIDDKEVEVRGYKNPLKTNKLRLLKTVEKSGKTYYVYEEIGEMDDKRHILKQS